MSESEHVTTLGAVRARHVFGRRNRGLEMVEYEKQATFHLPEPADVTVDWLLDLGGWLVLRTGFLKYPAVVFIPRRLAFAIAAAVSDEIQRHGLRPDDLPLDRRTADV